METHTHPDEWWDTDPRIVMTAIDVLKKRNRRR